MAEKITQAEIDARAVSNMPIRPNDRSSYGEGGLSPAQVRARFDALALLVIARYNELVDELERGIIGGGGGDPEALTRLIQDIHSGALSGYVQVYNDSGELNSLQNVLNTIYSEAIGEPGRDGVGIASIVQTETSTADGGVNVITITRTDGTTSTFTVRNGKTGSPGNPGDKGDPGVGIASIVQTQTSTADSGVNVFRVTQTDGSYTDLYVQNGGRGPEGDPGKDGKDGKDGATPVRGADYWTPTDKAEVIAEVLSNFTNAGEVAM